jgi:sortase (surface protein transpeptidase)
LLVTTRTFKVSKAQRSKKYKQLLIPIYHSRIRQVGFRIIRKPARRNKSRQLSFTKFVRKSAVGPAIFIIVGAAGIAFFTIQTTQGSSLEPAKTFGSAQPVGGQQKKAEKSKPKYLAHSVPTHIAVPAVGIDAPIKPVGKDPAGGIEMPALFDWTTGWYTGSPSPGQLGPAIIVGHVDTYKGISVFWKLRDVKPGDEIQISRTDGKLVTYKVAALKQFEQAAFPTKEVYGNIDHAGLRLITCGGAFNKATESYTQNTVVYADMVT